MCNCTTDVTTLYTSRDLLRKVGRAHLSKNINTALRIKETLTYCLLYCAFVKDWAYCQDISYCPLYVARANYFLNNIEITVMANIVR